jgi:hypothetical protein
MCCVPVYADATTAETEALAAVLAASLEAAIGPKPTPLRADVP